MEKRAINSVPRIILAFVVFALLYLYLRDTMFGAEELGKEKVVPASLIVLLGLIPLSYVFISGRFPRKGYAKPYITFILLVYVFSLLHPLGSGLYLITILLSLIYFFFSYIFATHVSKNVFLLFIIGLLSLLSSFFFFSYSSFLLVEIESRTMGAYTLLYFLPFVLCLENRILRISGMILILSTLFMSLKRGGIVAYSVSLFVYLLINYIFESEKKVKGILFFVVAITVLMFGFLYFDNQVDNMVTARFMGIEDDGGSHRGDLYKKVWNMIEQSSLADLVLGHGWDSVVKNNPMQYSAHNEFLEVMYDTGFLTLLALIIFVFSIIKYDIKLIKNKSILAAPMTASIALFIINSTISHTLLYAKYIILFSMFWGFILAERDKEIYSSVENKRKL